MDKQAWRSLTHVTLFARAETAQSSLADDLPITGTEGGKSQPWWCRLGSAVPL